MRAACVPPDSHGAGAPKKPLPRSSRARGHEARRTSIRDARVDAELSWIADAIQSQMIEVLAWKSETPHRRELLVRIQDPAHENVVRVILLDDALAIQAGRGRLKEGIDISPSRCGVGNEPQWVLPGDDLG